MPQTWKMALQEFLDPGFIAHHCNRSMFYRAKLRYLKSSFILVGELLKSYKTQFIKSNIFTGNINIHYEHFYSAPSRWLLRSASDSSTAEKP